MVIRPALADQRGNAIFISTPCGYNHFHEWYEQAGTEPDWQTFSYNTIEGGNVPEEEVELARRTLDERTFKQEFLASFETFSGRVFPEFDDSNVANDVADAGGPVLVGLDFNVGIMAGVICSKVVDQLHIWDEIAVKNSNTDEVAQMLRQRFPNREIICYPDPTGKARKTAAAGVTDHGILKKYGIKVVAPNSPWAVKDRLNATNWLIKNAEGERRMYVHPRCKNTIKGFRSVTYKEGAEDFVVDKDPGLEHWIDGCGYLILSAMNQVKPWKVGSGTSRQRRRYGDQAPGAHPMVIVGRRPWREERAIDLQALPCSPPLLTLWGRCFVVPTGTVNSQISGYRVGPALGCYGSASHAQGVALSWIQ